MVKKTKGKHRLDKFYHLAKEQGYRSRAAFKLVQLNRQFHFLDKARACLDLCAAPGGWMQVAVKTMPLNSLVLGMDLVAIRPIKGARSLVGDITTAKARAAIKKETGGSLMEVVLHDGAPNVGGVWSSEAYSQANLVLEALKLATDVLTPGGAFVTKIFRSADYNALLFAFKQLFKKVEATKPPASRNTSAEIFVVCLGYKAPSKIDPRLLDPKHLFEETPEAPKATGPDALLRQKLKQKRFRDGYEEGLSTLHRQTSVAAFVASEQPVEMLGQFTRFSFEASSDEEAALAAFLKTHPATDGEIKTLLEDLQVLGRSEFKQLLKWRLKVKKDFSVYKSSTVPTDEPEKEEQAKDPEDDEDKEVALLEEMQEVKDKITKRERREKKRKLKLKKKSRIRAAQLAMAEGIGEDSAGIDGLFSLATIQGPSTASQINDAEAPELSESDASEDEAKPGEASEVDSDEEDRQREAAVEAYLEEAYRQYKVKKGMHEEVERAKRARIGASGELASDLEEDTFEEDEPPTVEFEEEEEAGGGLLVDLKEGPCQPKSSASTAAQWFSQDLFQGAEDEDEDEDEPLQKAGAPPLEASPIVEDEAELQVGLGTDKVSKDAASLPGEAKGYEEVPMSASDSDSEGSSGTDLEEPNENTAAELRALAKAMLNGRRKNDIIEGAYNRYVFYEENLPPWFADDQKKYMRAPEVLSRDEIEAEKQRNKAIDTRPIKKVAEAKARKRKRLEARLEQARKKAGTILEQGDLTERAKAKEVEKLYAKAKAGGKGKKKPSRSDKYKKKGPPLDKRMFSDKRQVHHKSKARVAKRKQRGGAKNKGKGRK